MTFLKNDDDWKVLVRKIAGLDSSNREMVMLASEYLWRAGNGNYDRLHETDEGKFLREVDNEMPDLVLRNYYRKKLLAG